VVDDAGVVVAIMVVKEAGSWHHSSQGMRGIPVSEKYRGIKSDGIIYGIDLLNRRI